MKTQLLPKQHAIYLPLALKIVVDEHFGLLCLLI